MNKSTYTRTGTYLFGNPYERRTTAQPVKKLATVVVASDYCDHGVERTSCEDCVCG